MKILTSIVILAFFSVAFVYNNSEGDEPAREFVGNSKCKTCHKSEKQGKQYPIWEESKHAKAYEVLASEEAKAIAAEKGIDNAQEAGECLKCHIDGYGVDASLLGAKYVKEEGVGCESCHGAGGDYWKKATMQAITDGGLDGATVGLIKPDEMLCKKCHNEESPTYKEFNYDEMYAKIAHPVPPAE